MRAPRADSWPGALRWTRNVVLKLTLVLMLTVAPIVQEAAASRKFLTGLLIGALLARNGLQGGQPYPIPASYPVSGHPQQPLFIIIPSAGAKSYHKAHAAPLYDYDDSYGLAAARRLSANLKRRSSALLLKSARPARRPQPAGWQEHRGARQPHRTTSTTRAARQAGGRPVARKPVAIGEQAYGASSAASPASWPDQETSSQLQAPPQWSAGLDSHRRPRQAARPASMRSYK